MAPSARATYWMVSPSSIGFSQGVAVGVGHLGAGERFRQAVMLAVIFGAVPEARANDAGGAVAADELPPLVFARDVEDDEILQRHHITFHAEHLGDVGHLAR